MLFDYTIPLIFYATLKIRFVPIIGSVIDRTDNQKSVVIGCGQQIISLFSFSSCSTTGWLVSKALGHVLYRQFVYVLW